MADLKYQSKSGAKMFYLRKWMARRGFLKPLIMILKHKNADLRMAGILGLAELTNPDAAVPLCKMLEDDLDSIRLVAAKGLGKYTRPEAIEPLKKALGDDSQKIRLAAARSLKMYNLPYCLWGYVVLSGEAGEEERLESKSIIRETGQAAGVPLVESLENESWQVRAAAAEMLGEIKHTEAIDALIRQLNDEDVDVRFAITVALGKMEDNSLSDKFITILNDARENLRVRRAAAESLMVNDSEEGLLGHIWMMALGSKKQKKFSEQVLMDAENKVFEATVSALENGYWSVQKTAADLMGMLKTARCVEPLLRAADNNKPLVRLAIAKALGELGDARAIKSLFAMFDDSDWRVRAAAVDSVSRIKITESENPNQIENYELSEEVLSSSPLGESWEEDNEPTLAPLIALMRDGNENVRVSAAKALGDIGDAEAIEALCKGLKDLSDKVRAASAGALGKLKNQDAFKPLIGALNDWYSTVCNAAAQSLVQLGPPVDLWGHGWLIGGGTDQEKMTSGKIIKDAGIKAFEPLRAAIKDWSSKVRSAAALALGDIKQGRSVQTLCDEAVRSPLDIKVIQAVFTALSKLELPGTGKVLAKALIKGKFQAEDKPLVIKILKYSRVLAKAPWMTREDQIAIVHVNKKLLGRFKDLPELDILKEGPPSPTAERLVSV